MAVVRILQISPEYPVSASNFYVARSPRRRRSTAASFFRPARCVSRFQRIKQVRVSVFRVSDGQRGRGCVAVTPVDGGTGAIDIESQPEHGVRLIELDVFRQDGAFLTGYANTEVQIVRKVRLVR